jgi:hypothetical protein
MNLLSLLIAPLQAVVLFFAPHASAIKLPSARMPARSLPSAYDLAPGTVAQASPLKAARVIYPERSTTITARPIHRVRVVRTVDSGLPADRAGRMVVSGCFADVCAELDRLIAMEMRAA